MGERGDILEANPPAKVPDRYPGRSFVDTGATIISVIAITVLVSSPLRAVSPYVPHLAWLAGSLALTIFTIQQWRDAASPTSGSGAILITGWRDMIARAPGAFFGVAFILVGLLSLVVDTSHLPPYSEDLATVAVLIIFLLISHFVARTLSQDAAQPEIEPLFLSQPTVRLRRGRILLVYLLAIVALTGLYLYPDFPHTEYGSPESSSARIPWTVMLGAIGFTGFEILRNFAIIFDIPDPDLPDRNVDDWRDIMPITLLLFLMSVACAFFPPFRFLTLAGGVAIISQGVTMFILARRARAERMALG